MVKSRWPRPPVGPEHDMTTNAVSQVAERDTACQCCQLRSSKQHNQMLLCDGCQRGFHQHCLQQPLATVPKGDWLCPGCEVQEANGAQKRAPAGGACPPATGQACVVCCDPGDAGKMLLCDSCDCGFHWYCVGENHRRVPRGTWHCPALVKNPPIIPTFKVGILAGQVTIPTYLSRLKSGEILT
jgi:hypothetical protein